MKFLQTGDWHLGKIFHEMSLIPDQAYFLSQISDELNRAQNANAPYDALIVPGDIYDRAVPPSDAVTLLSTFLTKTHTDFPALHVFMLAGNHDSADRLSFASQILAGSNIHICTGTRELSEPVILGTGAGRAAVYQIPFLHPGEIKPLPQEPEESPGNAAADGQRDLFTEQVQNGKERILRTQQELVSEAAAQIRARHSAGPFSGLPTVVCAHLFTNAGHVSDSERSCVGTAEQVDADVFTPFSYAALGHLHGVQYTGKKSHVWYSGSPLAYSFDDKADTYMLSVIVEQKDGTDFFSVDKVPFKPLHTVVRLTGSFSDFYGTTADAVRIRQYADAYVEIVCTDQTVPDNPMGLLRQNFRTVLSFRKLEQDPGNGVLALKERRRVIESEGPDKPEKLFDMFIQDVYGGAVNKSGEFERERKLFLKLAENYSWTEEQQ
jgi:exonuclease SbcD